jgi:hypothetical protein
LFVLTAGSYQGYSKIEILKILVAKKKPPGGRRLFVFALFLTRRNASQSGEGKKECEEKRFDDHLLIAAL